MSWQHFSKVRFYLSVAIALIGVSAASTLFTPTSTLAETVFSADQPDDVKAEITKQLASLLADEAQAKKTLGDKHPKVAALRAQIAALEALVKSDLGKAPEAEARIAEKVRRAINVARAGTTVSGDLVAVEDVGTDDIVTDNIVGSTQRVIVRQDPDGNVVREVLALPAEAVTMMRTVAGTNVRELQRALEQLKDDDTSAEDKKAAREKIEKTLSEQFDEDLKQREKQIEDLEKQLTTLKQQIEKRRGAKKRLMELRMELLINESEGLGFPMHGKRVPDMACRAHSSHCRPWQPCLRPYAFMDLAPSCCPPRLPRHQPRLRQPRPEISEPPFRNSLPSPLQLRRLSKQIRDQLENGTTSI